MGYRVIYGPKTEIQTLVNSRKPHHGIWIWGIILIAAAAHVFLAEQLVTLRSILLPGFDEAAAVSLEQMVQQIEGGAEIRDAVSAFCEEIILRGLS